MNKVQGLRDDVHMARSLRIFIEQWLLREKAKHNANCVIEKTENL